MEQARLLLAIVLSFLVFVIWNALFVEKKAPTPPVRTKSVVVEKTNEDGKEPAPVAPPVKSMEESAKPVFPTTASSQPSLESRPDRRILVENDFYEAEFSERAGAITRFVLKKYRETAAPNSPDKVLFKEGKGILPIVGLSGRYAPVFSGAVFTAQNASDHLTVRDMPETLSFYFKTPDGLTLEKNFVFRPGSYQIEVDVRLVNNSPEVINAPLVVSLELATPDHENRYSFQGPSIYLDNKLEEIKIKKLEKKSDFAGIISWAGLEDQYFMVALIPKKSEKSKVHIAVNSDGLLEIDHINTIKPLGPQNEESYSFSLYLGPKRITTLKTVGHNLEKAVNFGFFDLIAKPCLWAMNMIYNHLIPNYGVAIILLTIFFKLLFWPLGNKSYKSMAEMKKLQPLMTEIRQKYKDDKKRMNEEVMGLYRTYKVNPMSGCLPMLVQIPVFFAFYRMLYAAIELRHAPFLLWINDLAAPDRLFHFNFAVPMMTPPYGIPVLTIIMGLTMFLQQKMSPPPGDPTQAKFMMLMPVIFTVIFINFPSGLVLYWMVNNILSISQQYYITRKIV
ncbi:MAG: membrane protein insertase YidC [Deltaproteobacteria bacterium]|nr:membrane protein insertase YidC [Deltaproteobacteria bacterium]